MAGKLEGDFLYYFIKFAGGLEKVPKPVHYYCLEGCPDFMIEYAWPDKRIGVFLRPENPLWLNRAVASGWVMLRFDREFILHPFESIGVVLEALRLRTHQQPANEMLNDSEMEILRLIAGGLNTEEIAERMVLSENYIKICASQICEKLGVRNRVSAVSRAFALRILSPDNIPWPHWVDL
jgi:DNA-binding CsgD family transcriptional regulator